MKLKEWKTENRTFANFLFFTSFPLYFVPKRFWCHGPTHILQDSVFCIISASQQLTLHISCGTLIQVTIFFNMANFLLLTPFSPLLYQTFTLCDAVVLWKYFRTIYYAEFPPPNNLYYILVSLWHFKAAIFFNLWSIFCFSPPCSPLLCLKFSLCDAVDLWR